MSEEMTTTSHKSAALTAVSALAMYDGAKGAPEVARAAAAMAEVLRAKLARPKAAKAAADLLTPETLVVTLKRMCCIVEARNSMPVLSCVLMESAAGRLTISATDLDMLYVETLRAPDLPAFKMAVPARDLASALVKATGSITFRDETVHYPGETVERHKHGNKIVEPKPSAYALVLILDGLEVRFSCMAPKDFPVMLVPHRNSEDGQFPIPPAASATMLAARLLDPLRFVAPAISKEEMRYYLNGTYMHVTVQESRPGLTFAATDGTRMLVERSLWDACGFDANMPGVILPRKSVEWILRNIRDEEVQVDVWAQQVRITTATGCYQTKVIDGNFPDYSRIIPSERAPTVAICRDAKAFAKVIGRLTAQTKERAASVTLRLVDGKASAHARNMEGGKISADLPLEWSGAGCDMNFNGRHLAEMVAIGEPITIDLPSGHYAPAKLLWPDHPGRIGVIMPLRR